MSEQRHCKQCSASFAIDDRDQGFYAKMQVPAPTLCPECRFQRRLAWRVEHNLYLRKCDLTGREMISIFPPDHPNKVYHHEEWYGDGWNPLEEGRPYDFNRPFFAQFSELMRAVPFFSLNVLAVQNSEYVNQCGWSKNCYFTIEADQNEDSMYCYRVYYVKTCVDCTECFRCERCYECTDCEKCFNLRYSQLCEQCRDSAFLFDCRSCNNCFGCVGLRQKQYHMFNEQLTKQEYEDRLRAFDFCDRQHLELARSRLEELERRHPRKSFIGEQNEDVTGNYLAQCKDCLDCYNVRSCRDCRYCDIIRDCKDCMDYLCWGDRGERLYECQECGHGTHTMRFCSACYEGIYDLTYCYQCCLTAAHCFGCVGIKKKEYCILNKQYSKAEYEELVPRIIEHMKSIGEYGEFFPVAISPHCYNETVAQQYFPLSRDEVLKRGWKWRDQLPFTKGKETISYEKIPERIEDVPDSILNEVLACEATGKNYRITKQELLFYRSFRIPIPRLHPDERHSRRMALRNPRRLWDRVCQKCGAEIKTSYQPSRPEVIYCERCYLETVY